MNEIVELCRAARALISHGHPGWLATVARVRGSAFRQPGARLLFGNGRALCGSISGGCLENDLVRRGAWLCEAGPRLVTYDARVEEEDGERVGTGCDGAIDVLVEPLDPQLIEFLSDCSSREKTGVVATIVRSSHTDAPLAARVFVSAEGERSASSNFPDSLAREQLFKAASAARARGQGGHHELSAGTEALVEVIEPPPRLFVFGGGLDAVCLLRLASSVGFSLSVCAPEPLGVVRSWPAIDEEAHFVTPEGAGAAIRASARPVGVVMTHSLDRDRAALSTLLASKARYIGVLGPARRCARLLAEIAIQAPELSRAHSGRVYGPAGLHLGGSSPAEVALSILAEAQAVVHGSEGVSLRARNQPIHAPLPEVRDEWRASGRA